MEKTRTISKEKLTSRLKNMSLHYLQRYSSSSANLEKYLRKKVREYNKEAIAENPEIMTSFNETILEVIAFLEKLGYLNDKLYSKTQLRSLLNKGKSPIAINYKLREKGLDVEHITEVVAGKDSQSMELYALLKFIKRKSFGSFRKPMSEELLPKKIEKEIASLARGGFSYEKIRTTLAMEKGDVEDLLYSLEKELDL
ncbi:MAG: RecX family transcriptional regulator [Alphaproteobacteria bacterium]|jgi:regulatory protein|nr:RecX family transcriptional regulator [Alphaproteobacteria bacterium]